MLIPRETLTYAAAQATFRKILVHIPRNRTQGCRLARLKKSLINLPNFGGGNWELQRSTDGSNHSTSLFESQKHIFGPERKKNEEKIDTVLKEESVNQAHMSNTLHRSY